MTLELRSQQNKVNNQDQKRVVSAAVKIEVEVETGSEAATKGWEYSLLNPVNVDRAEKKH